MNNFDLKDYKVIKQEVEKRCKLHSLGCENYVTPFKGEGSDLCREHQLLCEGWGGYAKPSRLHTFYKTELTCEWCGYDALADADIAALPEEARLKAARREIHVDHKHRKENGGADTEDNLQRLCTKHHHIKTSLEVAFKSNPERLVEELAKAKKVARKSK